MARLDSCRVLQVLRVVVAAVDDDQILDPARDVQIAVVERAVVAGAYPRPVVGSAFCVRRTGPRLEDVPESLGRLLWAVPIPGTHVVAADPDFTDLSVGQLAGRFGVDDDRPLVDPDLAGRCLRDGARRVGCDFDEP